MRKKTNIPDRASRCARFTAVFASVLVALAFTIIAVEASQRGGPAGAPAVPTVTVRNPTAAGEDTRDLVSLYVSVTDQKTGNPISGLRAANFVIREDDKEQEIADFLMDTAPVSLGVVWGPNIPLGDTITTFLKASTPNTEFFLVGNDTVIAPFSTDIKKAPRVIAQNDMEIFPSGGKDAMHIGLDVLSEASAYVRKIMLVVGRSQRANVVATPAFGNGTTYDSLTNAAIKGGMQIYTIIVQGVPPNPFAGLPPASINPTGQQNQTGGGFGTQNNQQQQQGLGAQGIGGATDINSLGQQFDETADSIALDGMAALTGGRSYLIQNTDTGIGGNDTSELEAVAEEIAHGLLIQYRLAYHPTNSAKDGKWRQIKISLVDLPKDLPKKLNVWTKAGYYAPKEPKKK